MTTSITRPAVAAEAVVDLARIAHNVETIASATDAVVMAVVKADAYGHGAVPVARTALRNGATWLGVTSCEEALRLRSAGITAPILSWLYPHDVDFSAAIAADIDLSAASIDHLTHIARAAADVGRHAMVHLKVDTGLSRGGALPADWPDLVALARRLERQGMVQVRGVWSHLIKSAHPRHPLAARQRQEFDEAVAIARSAGLDPSLRHVANSAAALDEPASHYDLVRPGIGLYGVEPVAGKTFGMRAALTLRAKIALVKRVPAGTGVSYDHAYVTDRPSTLALVPLGYADGVPRSVSGHARVSIGGELHPIVGTIAMDQFVVNLGDHTAQTGDDVVLIGAGAGEPTVTDWATWSNTIPHEILTGIGARVPRRHVGEFVPLGGVL